MVGTRLFLLFASGVVLANAQWRNMNFFAEKPGSCSPPIFVDVCARSCYVDAHCAGNTKCCPTSCGGTVCSRPVTMRNVERFEKAGSCPAVPTGRWICSSTCSTDGDCSGTSKCCKNRCGAFACQQPVVEVVESLDAPYNEEPEASANDVPKSANGDPYAVWAN